MRRIVLGMACLMGLASVTSSAAASGFDLTRIGGERGHAAASTPFATYYNPAALSGTRKVHIGGDLTLVLHDASYHRTDTSSSPVPADAPASNTGKATLFNAQAAPSLAASMRFNNFAVGLGIFAPNSGALSWNGNSAYRGNSTYPGAQDGRARWQMIQGDVTFIYYSLAASYFIPSIRLSLGAGGNLIYSRTRLLRAKTATNTDDLNAEGRIDLNTSAIVGSFSAGLMWEALAQRLWLAVSYQAPPGMYNGLTQHGTARTALGASVSNPKADLQMTMPDVFRYAVRYKEKHYELRAFGDYTRWSALKEQCVVNAGGTCTAGGADVVSNQIRNWQNSFGVRLGASYWFSEQWETFIGAGYESSAIPNAYLDATMIDGPNLSGALGARVLLGSRTALQFSYTHVQTLTRNVKTSELDASTDVSSRVPSGAGEYKQWLGMLNSFVEVYFD